MVKSKERDSKNHTLVEQHFYKMLSKNEQDIMHQRRESIYKLQN
jgi:hypothetical protein